MTPGPGVRTGGPTPPWASTGPAPGAGPPAAMLANATAYMEAFGHMVIAWIWLEQLIALGGREGAFAEGKRQACRYFFRWELPKIFSQLEALKSLDRTTLEMKVDWF